MGVLNNEKGIILMFCAIKELLLLILYTLYFRENDINLYRNWPYLFRQHDLFDWVLIVVENAAHDAASLLSRFSKHCLPNPRLLD